MLRTWIFPSTDEVRVDYRPYVTHGFKSQCQFEAGTWKDEVMNHCIQYVQSVESCFFPPYLSLFSFRLFWLQPYQKSETDLLPRRILHRWGICIALTTVLLSVPCPFLPHHWYFDVFILVFFGVASAVPVPTCLCSDVVAISDHDNYLVLLCNQSYCWFSKMHHAQLLRRSIQKK